ncbi:MAG: hypothetical protein MUF51_03740, partial [Vicinamibacteria bacterium]|nr:hypothetical protein [Vicinamibacteria bacterium]
MRVNVLWLLLIIVAAAMTAAQETTSVAPQAASVPVATPSSTPDGKPAASPALAPSPTASPAPAPTATPTPAPSPSPTPNNECSPERGDTCLTAEKQGREKGHTWGRGFADLRIGEIRVQTDSIDIFEREKPDGGIKQELIAEGNVVLMRKDERLAGTRMTMDLDTGRGLIDNVVGYMDPGVFVRAKRIERLDPKTFKITRGSFTSCCQPNPRWSFWAPSATLKVGDQVSA